LQFELSNQSITLVQITDCHLEDQVGGQLLGMDTDASLAHVLALIKDEQRSIDVLLATGDLSNCGSVNAYQRFQQLTTQLAEQTMWLPGNHDLLSRMQQALGSTSALLQKRLDIENWTILTLDSTIKGEVGGRIAPAELAFLEENLAASQGRHVLVCMHHHPIEIGCDWLDQQRIENGDELIALLARYDHVRGVLWGHIHQEIDLERDGVRYLASPSTCIQFAANSKDFKLDRLSPGYRWLELKADGGINTGVSRVKNVVFDLDYESSSGY
jgi:Icc protein